MRLAPRDESVRLELLALRASVRVGGLRAQAESERRASHTPPYSM